ncbi:TRAP transporter large permease [Christensenellaceae bacterium OttesenSCG-928-M15]|nr:TRAP transporter large permease [Christensenellaceae bacterium OttesenSCG-928-M15]
MNPGLICIIGLVVFSVIGIPIFFSLGIATMISLLYVGLPLEVLPQKMFVGLDSVALLAIPFFVLAGNIMSRTITKKLIAIAQNLIGWVRGSLAIVTIVASALFGAITGSAVATLSAIGGIMIPAMIRENYSKDFAAAVGSTSSILGPLIPPSITLIVYGSITETSIAALFKASVVPGVIFTLALVVYVLFYAKRHNLPKQERASAREIGHSLKEGIPALLMPIIILGGIFGGILTPTEAAAVSVIYAFIISTCVYKDMNLKESVFVFGEAAVATASMVILVATSKSTSYVIVTSQLPQMILNTFTSITSNPTVMLMLINVLFLIIGMIMESNAAIVMMTPLLMPLIKTFGIDPIHFGMIMSFNLLIGLLTPPVGVSILLGNTIAEARLSQTIKTCLPMMGIAFALLLLITYIPALTTWLPSL